MKTNGRRKWRRVVRAIKQSSAARKNRRGMSRRAAKAHRRRTIQGRARKEQGWGRAMPVSAKPSMDSRSLVGMSMSARKRAARMWLWPEDNRRDGLLAFREMIVEAPAVKVEYHFT